MQHNILISCGQMTSEHKLRLPTLSSTECMKEFLSNCLSFPRIIIYGDVHQRLTLIKNLLINKEIAPSIKTNSHII